MFCNNKWNIKEIQRMNNINSKTVYDFGLGWKYFDQRKLSGAELQTIFGFVAISGDTIENCVRP